MTAPSMNNLLQRARIALRRPDEAGITDGRLLGRFVEQRDEAAFAALVRRHAGMVWRVCRRLLNQHDAEDASQATFLVLARKAASVAPRERVANWLYGVAYKTALQARRTAARRMRKEKQVTEFPEPALLDADLSRDLQPLLHQELSRLPDAQREVLVLSDLEGKTRREIALYLGVPEGTVGSRLAKARATLAGRLARRGITLATGTLTALLTPDVASASIPVSLPASVVSAAAVFAWGDGTAKAALSAPVLALTQGVLQGMFFTKLRIAAALLFVVVSLGGGAGWIYQSQAQDATRKETRGLPSRPAEAPGPAAEEKTPKLQQRIDDLERQIQALTSEVKTLQKKLSAPATPPPAKTEAKVFPILNRNLDDISQMLWELYRARAGSEVRIGKDSATNSLIIVATPRDLEMIERIITQLEDLPLRSGKKASPK